MINKLISQNFLDILFKLFENEVMKKSNEFNFNKIFWKKKKKRPELIGYLAKAIAGLSLSLECRKKIIENEIVTKLIRNIYRNDPETKKQVILNYLKIR